MVGVLVVVVVWMLIVVVFDVMCFLCGWLLVVVLLFVGFMLLDLGWC